MKLRSRCHASSRATTLTEVTSAPNSANHTLQRRSTGSLRCLDNLIAIETASAARVCILLMEGSLQCAAATFALRVQSAQLPLCFKSADSTLRTSSPRPQRNYRTGNTQTKRLFLLSHTEQQKPSNTVLPWLWPRVSANKSLLPLVV